jgi:hypothetical protein
MVLLQAHFMLFVPVTWFMVAFGWSPDRHVTVL